MSRFVDGILVGLGIGLILMGGTMYLLIVGAPTEVGVQENETASQTASEWIIVRKYTHTTVTDTVTMPPSTDQNAVSRWADPNRLIAMLYILGVGGAVLGALLFLAGVVPPVVSKGKTPAPSND